MTRRALYAVSASRETRQSAARAVSHANDELSVFTVAGGWIIVREPLKEAFERIALGTAAVGRRSLRGAVKVTDSPRSSVN